MQNMDEIVLRVAMKAVIFNDDGKVLIVKESVAYSEGTQINKYGLPGGRIEIGENHLDGLKREVREEVGLNVEPVFPVMTGEWHPDIKGVKHQIIAFFIACKIVGDQKVTLSQEHDKSEWITEEQIKDINFMEPDDDVISKFFEIKAKLV